MRRGRGKRDGVGLSQVAEYESQHEKEAMRWIQRTHLCFCMLRNIIKPANKITYNMNFISSSSLDI